MLLTGYRVLDLADLSGALCTKLLADCGAEVIKIEPPEGDPLRRLGPFAGDLPGPDRGLPFLYYNTNKRSITLNLQTADARVLFRRLVRTADVAVETFPPGYIESLDLGYAALAQLNPGLILTSITPFGQTGPHRHFKGSDLVGLATGGMLNMVGDPGDRPLRVAGTQAYHAASAYALVGTLTALRWRNTSGHGQHVDVSVQESVIAHSENPVRFYTYAGVLVRRQRGQHPGVTPPRDLLQTKDGHWVRPDPGVDQGAAKAQKWRSLVAWMERDGMGEDLADDRYTDMGVRCQNAEHINRVVNVWAATHTLEELMEEGTKRGFAWARATAPAEVVTNPHLVARRFFEEVEHPGRGSSFSYPGTPFRTEEVEHRPPRRAPTLGEDNLAVYRDELGLSENTLGRLRAAGAI